MVLFSVLEISQVYSRYRNGTNTLPCGTPALKQIFVDLANPPRKLNLHLLRVSCTLAFRATKVAVNDTDLLVNPDFFKRDHHITKNVMISKMYINVISNVIQVSPTFRLQPPLCYALQSFYHTSSFTGGHWLYSGVTWLLNYAGLTKKELVA